MSKSPAATKPPSADIFALEVNGASPQATPKHNHQKSLIFSEEPVGKVSTRLPHGICGA